MQWTVKRARNYRRRFPHKREDVKVFHLFYGEANFSDITFSEPKKVLYRGVNLENSSFRGTDLRGVTFIGNNWYQVRLQRNGLKDEIKFLDTTEYYSRRELLPGLESTYRNIRFSLEENKDFELANDFFIGEMNAKRRQMHWWKRWFFSILAIYRMISNYGTSPSRVALVLFLTLLSHMVLIAYIAETPLYTSVNEVVSSDNSKTIFHDWQYEISEKIFDKLAYEIINSITYSIQTLTLQKERVELIDAKETIEANLAFVNTLYKLLGPIIIALFALTIRNRIKRN